MHDENRDHLVERARRGDKHALASLFDRHRERLKRMILLRMDRRIQQRVDASDILQEAFVDAAQRLEQYAKNPKIEFFLWLRLVTGQRLGQVHRQHVDAKMRDVGMEVSFSRGRIPDASTFCLASRLVAQLTSVSELAIRAEMQSKLEDVLNKLEPNDREILALKHFEEMTNAEIGQILGITESGANKRYVRALRRLRQAARPIYGLFDYSQAE